MAPDVYLGRGAAVAGVGTPPPVAAEVTRLANLKRSALISLLTSAATNIARPLRPGLMHAHPDFLIRAHQFGQRFRRRFQFPLHAADEPAIGKDIRLPQHPA